jgi:hypothetical protein
MMATAHKYCFLSLTLLLEGTYLWFPHEIKVMEEVGNGVATRAFQACGLPPKPSRDASPAEKAAYAQAKYGGGCSPAWRQAVLSTGAPAAPSSLSTSCLPPTQTAPTPTPPQLQATRKEQPPSSFEAAAPRPTPSGPPLADLICFDEQVNTPKAAPPASEVHDAFFAQFGL